MNVLLASKTLERDRSMVGDDCIATQNDRILGPSADRTDTWWWLLPERGE